MNNWSAASRLEAPWPTTHCHPQLGRGQPRVEGRPGPAGLAPQPRRPFAPGPGADPVEDRTGPGDVGGARPPVAGGDPALAPGQQRAGLLERCVRGRIHVERPVEAILRCAAHRFPALGARHERALISAVRRSTVAMAQGPPGGRGDLAEPPEQVRGVGLTTAAVVRLDGVAVPPQEPGLADVPGQGRHLVEVAGGLRTSARTQLRQSQPAVGPRRLVLDAERHRRGQRLLGVVPARGVVAQPRLEPGQHGRRERPRHAVAAGLLERSQVAQPGEGLAHRPRRHRASARIMRASTDRPSRPMASLCSMTIDSRSTARSLSPVVR